MLTAAAIISPARPVTADRESDDATSACRVVRFTIGEAHVLHERLERHPH